MNIRIVIVLPAFLLMGFVKPKPKVTLKVENASLITVFKMVEKQTRYIFNYRDEDLRSAKKVSIDVKNANVRAVLELCLKDQEYDYEFNGWDIFIKKRSLKRPKKILDQLIKITGKVININDQLISDVKLSANSKSLDSFLCSNGNFVITTQPNTVLTISAPGYQSQEIIAKKDTDSLIVRMEPEEGSLDEVLVIGNTTRKLNTSSSIKVSGKVFRYQLIANMLSGLSGRVPRLLVTQTNGLPESYIKTEVGGRSSLGTQRGRLPYNDPIYFVDGIPVAPNNNSLQNIESGSALGSNGRSPFAYINPDDIESIEVFKDADGTAIYGSRGAKAVVLITTKQGKSNELKLQVDFSTAMGAPTRLPQMLNTTQYLEMRNEALKNDNVTPTASRDWDLVVWDTSRNTNFKKLLLDNPVKITKVNISLSGGLRKIKFIVGATYYKETTVFDDHFGVLRGNLHMGINYCSPNQKFTATFSGTYLKGVNNLTTTDQTSNLSLPPTAPMLFDSSNKLNWGSKEYPFSNPLAILDQTYRSITDNAFVSSQFNFKIAKHFTIKGTVGFNSIWSEERSIIPIKSLNYHTVSDLTGTAFFAKNLYKIFLTESQLEYNTTVKKGKVTALIGLSNQELLNTNSSFSAFGYPTDENFSDTNYATKVKYNPSFRNKYSYQGMFERLGYNCLDKYIVQITGRQEITNRFGLSGSIGAFGAIGTAWIFSNEAFLKDNKILSFGKVRTSYGVTGNDPVGDYQYFDRRQGTSSGGDSARKDLDWEYTRKLNFGLELGFFNDKIFLIFDYYRNRSTNQLISHSSSGSTNNITNWPATIQNSGIELVLRFKNQPKEKLSWASEIILTIPRNKLISFPELDNSPYKFILKEGESLTVQQGYRFLGVDSATGRYRFKDRNDDGILSFPDDYEILGNLDPKAYGGIKYDMSVKNWGIGFFIEGRIQTGYSPHYAILNSAPPGTPLANQPIIVLDRWQKPGDHASFQMFSTGMNSLVQEGNDHLIKSDGRFADASFLRVKNIYINYTFPSQWLAKLRVKNASIYINAYNALTITKYKLLDPETQELYSLPPLKTYGAGFRIGF